MSLPQPSNTEILLMKTSRLRGAALFVMAAMILATAIAVAFTRTSRSQKTPDKWGRVYDAAKLTAPLPVISKIKGLEISGVSLINQGTPQATLVIEVINHRDEAVMALDFVSGEGSTTGGIAMDGLLDADNPLVIIPPHSLKTFEWNLASILEGGAVRLAAAIFSDGKEEGAKQSLEGIKQSRDHYQKKKLAEKAKNGGPR